MAGEIARLIGLLDDASTEVAEEAKAELISMGAAVVRPLAAAVTSLERFGRLSAIEVFELVGDVTTGGCLDRFAQQRARDCTGVVRAGSL